MKRRLGILALIIVQILSGLNTPIIHQAIANMSPFLFGFLRVGLSLLIIGPIALLARRNRTAAKNRIKRQHLLTIMLGSSLTYAVANLAFYIGIKHTSSIDASIILLLSPILFFILSIEILKEKFSPKIFAGLGLAFGGAAIAVLGPLVGAGTQGTASLFGSLMIIICVIADVIGILILKRVLNKVHALDALAIGLLTATVIYSVLAIPFYGQLSQLADPMVLKAVLYGSIMVGCIGYGLSYFALPKVKGSDFSVISYLQPISAIIAAVLFFNESFTPALMAGATAVFAGLYLVEAHKVIRHTKVLHR